MSFGSAQGTGSLPCARTTENNGQRGDAFHHSALLVASGLKGQMTTSSRPESSVHASRIASVAIGGAFVTALAQLA